MSAQPLLSPLVRKEFRALAPVWAASVGTLVVCGFMYFDRGLQTVGALACMLGATTLGALSIGHEYSGGTLGQLLAQPVNRHRLLGVKLAVLASLLVTLALAAALFFRRVSDFERATGTAVFGPEWAWTIVVLPLVSGLTVAPWLTMCCRNPMAGVVFTMGIPAALWAGQAAFVSARHDWNLAVDQAAFSPSVQWIGVLAASALAAVLGRRMFVRLEAIDGHAALSLPGLLSAPRQAAVTVAGTPRRRRHPVVQLVTKELRLQYMTLLVALLYVLVRTAMAFSGMPPDVAETLGGGVNVMYVFLVSLLVGSLASAEERALGTIDWQVLQPLAFWKQWTIKAATVLALALVLVLVLPLLLQRFNPVMGIESVTRVSYGRVIWPLQWSLRLDRPVVMVLLCVSCGLYISSLCRSGLRALLFTLSFVVVAGSAFSSLLLAARGFVEKSLDLHPLYEGIALRKIIISWDGELTTWMLWADFGLPDVLLKGFVVLLLVLGGRNHRSAEHGSMLARRQVGWLAAYVVAAAVAVGVMRPLVFYAAAIGW